MDYLKMLRELRTGAQALVDGFGAQQARGGQPAASWLCALRDRVPVGCLLCRERTPGGLCRYCHEAVCASMKSGQPRCQRCGLALPLPESPRRSAPGMDGIVEEALRSAAARLGIRARPGRRGGPGGGNEVACPDCRNLSPALERVVVAFDYAWPGELLIQQLKQQRRFSCAPVLAALLASRCRELDGHLPQSPALWREPTLVVPVPASHHSIVLRGCNPAAEVGRELARRLGLAWRPDVLLRVREGHRQKEQGRHARRRGVEGMYRCAAAVEGREIVVIDDVMTTGATLSVIARELKQHGALKVWGAVPARTPLRIEPGRRKELVGRP